MCGFRVVGEARKRGGGGGGARSLCTDAERTRPSSLQAPLNVRRPGYPAIGTPFFEWQVNIVKS